MAGSTGIGVIFDMDGVLVDSAGPHFESWRRLGEELGFEVAISRFAATFGRRNCEIIPLLFGAVSAERAAAMSERKEEIYRELIRERVPVVEGAAELVRALAKAGVAMAIGSSGPRANIDLVLAGMDVGGWIDVIVSADDVTRGKPDPQVFALTCERLDIPASRCVVIEDAPAGIMATKAVGAKAVAVLMYHPREAFDGADLIVEQLSELTVERLRALLV